MIDSLAIRPIEILFVEDNSVDIRVTQEAFNDFHVANTLHVVRDGVTAMDSLYQCGEYKDAPALTSSSSTWGCPERTVVRS